MANVATADFVTLESGQVITVPEWGEPCRFDDTYCPRGWLPDGSFPWEIQRDFLVEGMAQKAAEAFKEGQDSVCPVAKLDYPLCGLVVSPALKTPCYELVY